MHFRTSCSNAKGIHQDKKLDLEWKKKGQVVFMEYYNKSVEEFITLFVKNYLD